MLQRFRGVQYFLTLGLLLLLLVACGTKSVTQVVEKVVKETQIVKETQVVTVKETEVVKVVETKEVSVEITVVVQPTGVPTQQPQPTQVVQSTATAVPVMPEVTQPPVTSLPTSTPRPESPQPTATPVPVTTQATQLPPSALPTATQPVPTPTVRVEKRYVELEWPPRMRLGDSDVVRLSLIPSTEGYTVTTEFPDHTTVTQTMLVQQITGYELSAVARLDTVGFDITPTGDQIHSLPEGDTVLWRWALKPHSPGSHRISITLLLRWSPVAGAPGSVRESIAYSKSLTVAVNSFFGLTRGQAMTGGLFGLLFGGSLSLFALGYWPHPKRARLLTAAPNERLVIEARPGIEIVPHERNLLRSIFRRYARLSLESEFLSGYSGARTFLALPIRPDGRADAYTIVKIGERESIRREFENYETFVKDTLPPITARIQHTPVALPSPLGRGVGGEVARAALQYTFIGAPGQSPRSLRQELLANPDPALLDKLFETFGPNWWMQRHPYSFRLAQEYDRMLPAHYVIEPDEGRGLPLDGREPPRAILAVGMRVTLRNFIISEVRPDGRSLSLRGALTPGQPPLRIRWLGLGNPNGACGRVVATRQDLMQGFVASLDRFGLPDPLVGIPALLDERLSGTQSTIHGDLNLENVLVGPGGFGPSGFVWLIDFAQTRDGHPLFDFAHLEADLIAHVFAPQIPSPGDYLGFLEEPGRFPHLAALSSTLHTIASRCLFNPSQPREYYLAQLMACLGALKFTNLDAHAKQLLYLTAAHVSRSL